MIGGRRNTFRHLLMRGCFGRTSYREARESVRGAGGVPE